MKGAYTHATISISKETKLWRWGITFFVTIIHGGHSRKEYREPRRIQSVKKAA